MIMREKPILSGDRILLGDAAILWDGELALRMELVKSKRYGYPSYSPGIEYSILYGIPAFFTIFNMFWTPIEYFTQPQE